MNFYDISYHTYLFSFGSKRMGGTVDINSTPPRTFRDLRVIYETYNIFSWNLFSYGFHTFLVNILIK